MTTWVYVDESKYRGYLLATVSIAGHDLPAARRLVNGLVLPGQHRLHMRKERPSRKKRIIAALCEAQITAAVYADHHHRDDLAARSACLDVLVSSTAGVDTRLVIEQDDGLVGRDRADLHRAVHQAELVGALTYEHRRAGAERLLGLADVVAWSWAKGGDWRRRIRRTVTTVRRV